MRTMLFAVALVALAHPEPAEACRQECQPFYVPVSVSGVPDAKIYGELCLPAGGHPKTVQLLVHTTGANHYYWDPPAEANSYVKAALTAGYATFNVDRFGTGLSTKPISTLVDITTIEDTLHQVIAQLRAGNIGSRAFQKVMWVGSSYGAAYGWVNATRHPGDIDGYIFTSIMHYTKPSFMATLALPAIIPACVDPVFSSLGLDCGYISTALGSIGPVYFYEPTAAPGMLGSGGIYDTVIRDVVSLPLLGESLAVLGGITLTVNGPVFTPMPVDTDFARGVNVPSLVVIGDRDNIFCGAPDGLACDEDSIQAFEAPYYGHTPEVYVARESGHAFALQLSAQESFRAMLRWARAHVSAR